MNEKIPRKRHNTEMTGNAIQPDMIPVDFAEKGALRWQAQLQQAWRDPAALLAHLGHNPGDFRLAGSSHFPFLVTRAFAERMMPGDPHDPLLRQVLPLAEEDEARPEFGPDPVGDAASRAVRGVLHKYHGRALLIATGACPIHCRYCFRREFDYTADSLSGPALDEAIAYISQHPDIEEVILSGGDPLLLATGKLRRLARALAGIGHFKRLRIHTRVPVTLPMRIDAELCDWLDGLDRQLVVVVHANHAREFGADVAAGLARLRQAGATVFNQAVLLAGVNDRPDTLADLMETGFAAGAIPYYLHLLDRVSGSAHFEVPRAHALRLMRDIRKRLPGYLVPRLVEERAGAPYKIPVF